MNNPKGGEKMDFQISLKAARVNVNMTQQEVANLLNINKSTIASWEKGKTQPKYKQASKLSKIYGIPYDNINFSV
nr:MAG TPA: Repressor protein CI [Caudoviricetes sp.]